MSRRRKWRPEVRTRAVESDGSRGVSLDAHDASRVPHPLLHRELDVNIESGSFRQRYLEGQQRATGAYVAQRAGFDEAGSTVAGAFDSDLPIYLKPLSSSAFDQRASSVLQTDCLIDDLVPHCCFYRILR